MEKELLEQLQKATKALQTTNDRAEQEKKEFGDALQDTKNQIDQTNEQITKMQEKLNEIATKANRRNKLDGSVETDEEIKQKEMLSKAFAKYVKSGGSFDALELEERRILQGKTMNQKALVADAVGDIIIPTAMDNEIYREVYETTKMRQLARRMSISNADEVERLTWNRLDGGWGKVEAQLDELDTRKFKTDLIPETASIRVHNLYAATSLGEDLLEDSAVNLTQLLQEMFAETFAWLQGDGFLNGRGNDAREPEGLLQNKVINRDKLNGGHLLDALLRMQYQPTDPISRTTGEYLMRPEVELYTRTQKDENGKYMWQPPVQAGKPATLFGRPVNVDYAMRGEEAAVYGDFKRGYLIVDRKGITMRRYDQAPSAMENDLIPFRAKMRVGGGVVRPGAFTILEAEVPEIITPSTP